VVNLRENTPAGPSGGADAAGHLYGLENGVFGISDLAYKSIVLEVGGAQLYRKRQLFFIGLLIGYAVATCFSCAVDSLFFFGQGIWCTGSERGAL